MAGLMLIPHVWPKLMAGPSAVAANAMVRRGIEPALIAAYLVIITEVLGAICITLGFLTRLVAALLVIEFLVIERIVQARDDYSGILAAGRERFRRNQLMAAMRRDPATVDKFIERYRTPDTV